MGPPRNSAANWSRLARAAGLLAPHVGREWGGLGLDHRGKAVVFEAAGYAPLATIAMNIFAPDEANMHLLEQVASEPQKEEWLRPLAAGRIRSCFMMTEPAPGAGADPSMLLTTARRDSADGHNAGDFVIDGEKWLITGAIGAAFAIIMAKTESDPLGPAGATMFLAPMDAPGIHIERVLDTLDQYMSGGHAVIRLDGLRVPETAVLGRVGEGFRYAQARLAPARLTHCMRWLGAARRAHDIATDYARRRTAFGKPLGEHEGVGFMLADNEKSTAGRSPSGCGGWLAEAPELPGCMSDGETPQQAVENLMDAITCWIEAAEEDGRPVPVPAPASADAA
jgi:acyl-CoA dehydrogenase